MAVQSELSHYSDIDDSINTRLAALVECAVAADPLQPHVLAITRSLGFESFSYAVTTVDPALPYSSETAIWTTLPEEWLALYERMHYAAVDPRLINTYERTTPYVWDAASSTGDCQLEAFLRDAARFGIRSGVVVSLRDARHARAVVALNSQISPVSADRRTGIQLALGNVMLFAVSFHDVFMQRASKPRLVTPSATVRLSVRERQCLRLAACGMTSADIGSKLGITARTANFHFSNLIGKLGVINRHEAIARAVSIGLI